MVRRPTCPTAPPPRRAGGQALASVTDSSGRPAIAGLLQHASNGDAQAFGEADVIRRRLGLAWGALIDGRRAA